MSFLLGVLIGGVSFVFVWELAKVAIKKIREL